MSMCVIRVFNVIFHFEKKYYSYQQTVRKSKRANMTNFLISIYQLNHLINQLSYLDLSR